MLAAERGGRIARFGAYELDRHTGELRKHGVRIRLQTKPYQILLALLEKPGELVTREELRQRLWSDDTFVDFDSGLNTATNRLRIALGDSADNPRYIETLSRSGYRFIAPVEEIDPNPQQPVVVPEEAKVVVPVFLPAEPSHRGWLPWALCGILLVVAVGAFAGVFFRKPAEPSLQQITFRRGTVLSARFAPDGQTVLYTARWDQAPRQIYQANSLSPESRGLGMGEYALAAISRSSELALLEIGASADEMGPSGLARVPLNGGAPLVIAKGVAAADWSPDGGKLAVIRYDAGNPVIEYPIGNAIYKSSGYLTHLRVSPMGDALAFFDHPFRGDDGGQLRVIDLKGNLITKSQDWASANGVAWAPQGREVLFTASRAGAGRSLYAMSLKGKVRVLAKVPGALTLHDVSSSGRVLISRDNANLSMAGMVDGDHHERDLSWFDWSRAVALSSDGTQLLFDESGEGAGPKYNTFIRRLDTGETIKFGDGRAMALSQDGKFVATMAMDDNHRLRLAPVAPGTPKVFETPNFRYQGVKFFPDAQRLLVVGSENDQENRLYIQDLSDGKRSLVETDMYPMTVLLSGDGSRMIGRNRAGDLAVQTFRESKSKPISAAKVSLIGWTDDPEFVFVRTYAGLPTEVSRLRISDGALEPWLTISPANREGVSKIASLVISRDGKSYAYSYHRTLSELYTVDGWTE